MLRELSRFQILLNSLKAIFIMFLILIHTCDCLVFKQIFTSISLVIKLFKITFSYFHINVFENSVVNSMLEKPNYL